MAFESGVEGPHVLRPGARTAPGEKACLPKPEERRGGDRGPAPTSISGCLSDHRPLLGARANPTGLGACRAEDEGGSILQGSWEMR